jgi:Tol biopolymer transport system component
MGAVMLRLPFRVLLSIFGTVILIITGAMTLARVGNPPPLPWLAFVSNRAVGETLQRVRPFDARPQFEITGDEPERNVERLTQSFGFISSPAYSPDGRWIAFVSSAGAGMAVYRVPANGGNADRLTPPDLDTGLWFGWSPDSQWIVFVGLEGDYSNLYLLRADGSPAAAQKSAAALTTGPNQFNQPAWSPDGEWIAYVTDFLVSGKICRMRPDGSDVLRLTEGEYKEQSPLWSPDSQWIVFVSARGGGSANPSQSYSLYRMRPDGSDIQPMPNLMIYGPAWSPDGRWIAFTLTGDIYRMRADRIEDPGPRDMQQMTTHAAGDFDAAWAPPLNLAFRRWLALAVGLGCLFAARRLGRRRDKKHPGALVSHTGT